jgi:hypothetical protein
LRKSLLKKQKKAGQRKPRPNKNIFINCPFDPEFKGLLDAIVFAVLDIGYVPRCSLEGDNAAQIRFDKICSIIRESDYSIHDISYVRLDPRTRLPRFNMPLELGLYLGCRVFGGVGHGAKNCLILDKEQYRYMKYISDISGQDIHAHKNKAEKAVHEVRDWIVNLASSPDKIPSGAVIWNRYEDFKKDLPQICGKIDKNHKQLTFVEYVDIVRKWRDFSLAGLV